MMMESPDNVRAQFPQLQQVVHGQRPVYLDSAATTLKPWAVIKRLEKFYSFECANVHRGAHWWSDEATGSFEQARKSVAQFLGARDEAEIVFTRGTTEGVNLVAQAFGGDWLKPGDEILLTQLEHHSNIVPWQILAEKTGATIRVVRINENGEVDLNHYKSLLNERTKIVSFTHISNGLGSILPAQQMIQEAREAGAVTLLDAAQSVSFLPLNVQDLNCDFLVFSGHKLFGPYGIGVLYGRLEMLNSMKPYQSGGSMISKVTFEKSDYLPSPQRFEAGTPHIAGAIGLAAAIQFFSSLSLQQVQQHETRLLNQATEGLKELGGVRIFADHANKAGIVSFLLDGAHPSDVGAVLDQQGVAVRAGHHCNQPLMDFYVIPGTVRASFSIYNDEQDVLQFLEAVKKAKELLL